MDVADLPAVDALASELTASYDIDHPLAVAIARDVLAEGRAPAYQRAGMNAAGRRSFDGEQFDRLCEGEIRIIAPYQVLLARIHVVGDDDRGRARR